MITVVRTPEFDASLLRELDRAETPVLLVDFLLNEYVDISLWISQHVDLLAPHSYDEYRRILIATYPPGATYASFYYTVIGFLLPSGVLELEDITIDWDVQPLDNGEEVEE